MIIQPRQNVHVVARRNSRGTLRVHTICPVLKEREERHKDELEQTVKKLKSLKDALNDIVKLQENRLEQQGQ